MMIDLLLTKKQEFSNAYLLRFDTVDLLNIDFVAVVQMTF